MCPKCGKNPRNKWIPEFSVCNECLANGMMNQKMVKQND